MVELTVEFKEIMKIMNLSLDVVKERGMKWHEITYGNLNI